MNKTNDWKKTRQIERYEQVKKAFFIFCEGLKTEPNYFDSIKTLIGKIPIYRRTIVVETIGLSLNTIGILEYAENFIKNHPLRKYAEIDVWCVYDKDDFPAEHFNSVYSRTLEANKNSKGINYKVAWSNQCIEYWFMLHFAYYKANNHREYYLDFLKAEFKKRGIGSYKKNDPEIFDKLLKYGDVKKAISYAENQLKEFEGQTDANSAPATKVHLLVSDLAFYFPEEIKNKVLEKDAPKKRQP